jgi:ABC-type glutathione transport system ATPase component
MNGHALLEARSVTVRFGGLVAVDAVSAAFAAGELVGIIGPNGAGKTTFFNALSGVQLPTSGELYAHGDRLTGARPHRYAAQGIARTFQTPRVFAELTVRANVQFGLEFAGRGRKASWLLKDAQSILNLIGLSDQAALPAAGSAARVPGGGGSSGPVTGLLAFDRRPSATSDCQRRWSVASNPWWARKAICCGERPFTTGQGYLARRGEAR